MAGPCAVDSAVMVKLNLARISMIGSNRGTAIGIRVVGTQSMAVEIGAHRGAGSHGQFGIAHAASREVEGASLSTTLGFSPTASRMRVCEAK
jgi:hypothetical protein